MTINLGKSSIGSIPGPDDITRAELPNSVVVLARANFNSPSVMLTGYLHAGGLYDPDDKLGLASFTADALMRGTQSRDFQAIYDALESAGASLSFSGGTHTTGFSGKCLAEDFDLLLGILSNALREPVFPPQHVERLRANLLTGLAMRAQDTGEMASLAFDKLLYPGHPYSRNEDGYPETVRAISREDLVAFHQKYYGPKGLILSVVGGIDPHKVIDQVKAIFSGWSNPEQPDALDVPDAEAPELFISERVEIPGMSQSDIVMGAPGPRRHDQHYIPAAVGNNILGVFGLMGRIGDVVREKAGLAYYAYSQITSGMGPAPWVIRAGVNPANEQAAVDLIRKEIGRFTTELVSEEELADSQSNYIGRLPLALESNMGVAGAILNLERYSLPMDYYIRYPDMISAVTREQVLEAASAYLHPDKLAAALAGPPLEI